MPVSSQEEKYSVKTIGGQQIKTVNYFPIDPKVRGSAALYKTISGDYIHTNGELVKVKDPLKALPEQHRTAALDWWNKKYVIEEASANKPTESPKEPEPGAEKKEDSRLMDAITFLTGQVGSLKADLNLIKNDVEGLKGMGPPIVVKEEIIAPPKTIKDYHFKKKPFYTPESEPEDEGKEVSEQISPSI